MSKVILIILFCATTVLFFDLYLLAPKNLHVSNSELTALAEQEFENQNYLQALDYLEQAISNQNSPVHELYRLKAEINISAGNFNQALEDINQAIVIIENSQYKLLRAELLFRLNKKQLALDDLSEILNKFPNHQDALLQRGTIYFQSGENHNALKDFNQAINLTPKADILYFNRALVYTALGQNDKSIADMRTFVKLSENQNLINLAKDKIKQQSK